MTFGNLQTPITLTFAVDPPELVRIEPGLVVVMPNIGGDGPWLMSPRL